jgi:hypothetical protein
LACRNKVIKTARFKTPADADAHYFGITEEALVQEASESVERVTLSEPEMRSTGSQTTDEDMTEVNGEWLKNLSEHDQLEKISELFQSYVLVYHSITVPSDFLGVSARAMAQLK